MNPTIKQLCEWQRALDRDVRKAYECDPSALEIAIALQKEVTEYISELSPKYWKVDQRIDFDKAKMELVDVLHFVLSSANELFDSSEEFAKLYKEKNDINRRRFL